MIISEELKHSNIAEYILYMWQTEDLLRSLNFDLSEIKTAIIDEYQSEDSLKRSIEDWYSGLIQMAELEGVKQKGHLQVITNIVNDLNDLHLWLLHNPSEIKYKQTYQIAQAHILAMEQKMEGTTTNEIDICLHGLYALLLLNLKKKEISNDTKTALNTFKELISQLASKYHDRELHPKKYYE